MDEEQVQRTASDAARAKTSMSRLGYYRDNFVASFIGAAGSARCSPLINRGYYARFKSIDTVVRMFVQKCAAAGAPSQVVVFGGGSDTMYYRFLEEERGSAADQGGTPTAASSEGGEGAASHAGQPAGESGTGAKQHSPVPSRFVELDLLENSIHKVSCIARTPKLMELLRIPEQAAEDEHCAFDPPHGVLHTSRGYSVLPCDLRDVNTLDGVVSLCRLNPDAPTLFLSECVLIYMEPPHADAAIKWAASTFANAAFLTYEQISPDDPFGRMMVQNLRKRGCALRTIHAYPTLASQVTRYSELGFNCGVHAQDMNHIYEHCIDSIDRRRIEKLELFDEFEEWCLIQGHYCLVLALKQRLSSKAKPIRSESSKAENETGAEGATGTGEGAKVGPSPGLCGFPAAAAAFFGPEGKPPASKQIRTVSPVPWAR